jgi:hypothetical protein
MALIQSIDWITGEITVSRNDMPLAQVSPEVRTLDTNAFFTELKDAEASLEGAPWPDTQTRTSTYTVGGVTYSASLQIIPPYFVTFEDGQYRVVLEGTNNNIIEVATANQVGILGNNSSGLVDPSFTDNERQLIVQGVFDFDIENGETFQQQTRLIRAEAAGSIVKTGTEHRIKGNNGSTDRIVANADEDGRTVTSTNG